MFCALCLVCPGSAVSWNRKDCNRQSIKRVQITWSIGLVCAWLLGHKCSFPNSHFLGSVVRNNKRSSGIEGKTSDCLSRNCLYYRYTQGRRQRGGRWCPAPPFEIGAPHFTFVPPVAAYIQYCILKMCPPCCYILATGLVILSCVSAGNCSLNHLNLWLLFFRWFPHGTIAACEKLSD